MLAIQGDFERHIQSLVASGCSAEDVVEVRTTDDLERVSRLIIPGGESTTVGLLLERYGLGAAIMDRANQGMPVWGTCMGMILMASAVEDRSQYTLNLLDITVQRNAFGAQVHSFEDAVQIADIETPVLGVFIRAPIVTRVGPQVEVVAKYEGKIVGVRQGKLFGTSFHPELTDDVHFHRYFLGL